MTTEHEPNDIDWTSILGHLMEVIAGIVIGFGIMYLMSNIFTI